MTREGWRPIALIGLMGAGKSTVARVLGERLGVSVADLDEMIEAEAGLSVAALFEREGEAWFRRREGELLDHVMVGRIGVVACGGGIVVDAGTREKLRRACRVVWLEVTPGTAARRVEAEADRRPMLAGDTPERRLATLLQGREALYAETARVRVATDGRSPEVVADEIVRALGEAE